MVLPKVAALTRRSDGVVTDVGYSQGMAFLAGYLLLHMHEKVTLTTPLDLQ